MCGYCVTLSDLLPFCQEFVDDRENLALLVRHDRAVDAALDAVQDLRLQAVSILKAVLVCLFCYFNRAIFIYDALANDG